jgi:hypothetical protein
MKPNIQTADIQSTEEEEKRQNDYREKMIRNIEYIEMEKLIRMNENE